MVNIFNLFELCPDWFDIWFCFANVPHIDCPRIFTRHQWAAKPPRNSTLIRTLLNAPFVVIHHTSTTECFAHGTCSQEIRRLQSDHIFAQGLNDIAYNFLITSSGAVYEGRGWYVQAENVPGFVDRSLSIAFHGTFETVLPPDKAMAAYRALIACGMELEVFPGNRNPKVITHRQLTAIACPGTALYRYILTWTDFEPNPKKSNTG